VDVLCADKTGTLTQNKLTLAMRSASIIFREQIVLTAALASREENNDTIDLLFWAREKQRGVEELSGGSFHAIRPGA